MFFNNNNNNNNNVLPSSISQRVLPALLQWLSGCRAPSGRTASPPPPPTSPWSRPAEPSSTSLSCLRRASSLRPQWLRGWWWLWWRWPSSATSLNPQLQFPIFHFSRITKPTVTDIPSEIEIRFLKTDLSKPRRNNCLYLSHFTLFTSINSLSDIYSPSVLLLILVRLDLRLGIWRLSRLRFAQEKSWLAVSWFKWIISNLNVIIISIIEDSSMSSSAACLKSP